MNKQKLTTIIILIISYLFIIVYYSIRSFIIANIKYFIILLLILSIIMLILLIEFRNEFLDDELGFISKYKEKQIKYFANITENSGSIFYSNDKKLYKLTEAGKISVLHNIHQDTIDLILIDPINNLIITSTTSNPLIVIYDINKKFSRKIKLHSSIILDIIYLENNNSIISTSKDNTIIHFNYQGEVIIKINVTETVYTLWKKSSTEIILSSRHSLKIWDLTNNSIRDWFTIDSIVTDIQIGKDQDQFYLFTQNGEIIVIDNNMTMKRILKKLDYSVFTFYNSNLSIIGDKNGKIEIFNHKLSKKMKSKQVANRGIRKLINLNWINQLLVQSYDNKITLIKNDGKIITQYNFENKHISDFCFIKPNKIFVGFVDNSYNILNIKQLQLKT